MFGMQQPSGAQPLFQMKAGKLNLENTTLTSDPRKGLLILRKAEDGLMHLIWKDRNAGSVVDDLIVFEGDATIRYLDQCKDGFAMLLEFSQTARKLFFYSQEPRKKGLEWTVEDTSKERELLDKANSILTGGSAPAPAGGTGTGPGASAGAGAGGGALGMTQNELMALLGGAAAAGGGPTPSAAALAAGGDGGPSGGASPAAASMTTAPAASGAAAGAFSADSIANILGNIPPPTADTAAAGGAFSADAISSILGNIPPAQSAPAVGLGDVLRPETTIPAVDSAMEQALAEHLPQGGNIPESARDTLSTPQMAQASTDAAASAAAPSDAMETDKPAKPKAEDKMDES